MADYPVIGDVSETLRSVLAAGLASLTPPPAVEVHDLQGTIPTSPAHVTICLYDVVEDPSAKNRPRRKNVDPAGNIRIDKAPMALLLRYLVTPWSGTRAADHQILGRVMQILYDGAIIHGPALTGSLAGTSDALKIMMSPIPLQERFWLWQAVQKAYRISVTYEVRVVNLDAVLPRLVRPVAVRELDYHVPGAP
jgi:Pvc16 N-terminal domain